MNRAPAYDDNRPCPFRNAPYDLRSSVAQKAMIPAEEVQLHFLRIVEEGPMISLRQLAQRLGARLEKTN